MIATTPEFLIAQAADSVKVAFLVEMVLGDYAANGNGATASSSGDASADYPAAGAFNSDHTEINIGSASAADNGVGRSSWKSSAAPIGDGAVWLQSTFSTARTINRIKLYNLASDPLTSYLIQYYNGSTWVDVAGTPAPGSGGYGTGSYGSGVYGGPGPGPGAGYTGGLDVYDFSDITTTAIRVVVYATTSAGAAQVVELEAYRKVDITDRVTAYSVDRRKDYKFSQPIATQFTATLDNTDRFFSPFYTPTAAEVAEGFVNDELLLLGFDIELSEGFYTTLGPEVIRTFTGNVDSITTNSKDPKVQMVARDYMKFMVNHQDSCKLQTNIDITDSIKYTLNRCGFSNYEMNTHATTIIQPYFFYYEQEILTTIQKLIEAAGDAIFYFDENGLATMRYYLTATPQQNNYADQAVWLAGTITNCNPYTDAPILDGTYSLFDDFSDNLYTGRAHAWLPDWTITLQTGNSTVSVVSPSMAITGSHTPGQSALFGIQASLSQDVGTRRVGLNFIPNGWTGNGNNPKMMAILYQANTGTSATGYGLYKCADNHVYFTRWGGGTKYSYLAQPTNLADCGALSPGVNTWAISRDINGVFNIYKNSTLVATYTDLTYTTFQAIAFCGTAQNGGAGYPETQFEIDVSNILVTPDETSLQGVWQSTTLDRGTSISSSGIFQATPSMPLGTNIQFYTQTSTDNINFTAWALATPGAADPSPSTAGYRYENVKAVFSAPAGYCGTLPQLFNITLSWYTGTGQKKWSASVDFYLTHDNAILDIQEQVADGLSGDTAIVNDVAVTTAPLVLSGAGTDDQWKAVTGTPPSEVSVANPLTVNAGTTTFNPTISSGMDTSGMSGGSCIAITWGTATGTAAITYIHPTKPILTLTVTNPGTITDLRIIGKGFTNLQTPYQSTASDASSIARYRKRHSDLQNDYFRDSGVTAVVAARIIANQAGPVEYIPGVDLFPARVDLQPGDRVNVSEPNSGILQDYYVVGFTRSMSVSGQSGDITENLVLMRIPIE